MIIELDTVIGDGEQTAQDAGRAITNGYDVTFTIVAEHGPAGGHPVIRYEGEQSELRAMVHAHYDKDTLETIGLL